MILQRLSELYERLLESPDPETGAARVPPYGFTDENISYCLVLSRTGELVDIQDVRDTSTGGLVDIQDVRDTSEGKHIAKRLRVPQSFKRSGTNPRPFFLWDKTAFVLGIKGIKAKKVDKKNPLICELEQSGSCDNNDNEAAQKNPWVLSDKNHRTFKQFHLELLANTDDAGLMALRQFLLNWKPENFSQPPFSLEHVDANVVFKLYGEVIYIHESSAAKRLWLSFLKPIQQSEGEPTKEKNMCLVTGEKAKLSLVHPWIKGEHGGHTAGVSIVSFDKKAYESFGKSQGENAPVSEQAAFAYTTALNYMLRDDNDHCLPIGDTRTVFWAIAKSTQEESQAVAFFSAFANPPSDEGQAKKLRFSLEKISKGCPFEEIAPDLDPKTRFYVLGLAHNTARLSICYWIESTLGELGQRLSEHWHDMQIEPLPWNVERPPSVRRCLIETVRLRKEEKISGTHDGHVQEVGETEQKKKKEKFSLQLVRDFLRSILTGERYPRALLTLIVQRLRSDGDINGLRVALIKAVLQRDHRKGFLKEGIPMSLDLENTPIAYRLGCLFAVLERAQSKAIPKANSTIVDRCYGSASTVPYTIFPRLIAGFQHHVSKIRKDKPGVAVYLDKQIGSILNVFPGNFPRQLSIVQQGQFVVGYYQQKQNFFFEKLEDPETPGTGST